MHFNKRTKGHIGVGKLVLFEMFYHERDLQELMKLRKSQDVNGNEQYADCLFHKGEGTKDGFSNINMLYKLFKPIWC